MSLNNYVTNLFDGKTSHGTLASNGRASIVKSSEGRIYVIIDGVTYSANRDDLFGINDNINVWLDSYVKKHDLEIKKHEFNDEGERRISKILTNMKKTDEQIEISRKKQLKITENIKILKEKFYNYLEECGVTSKGQLVGEQKTHANNLYNERWAEIFNKTSEGIKEDRLLSDNCSLAFDKGKVERQIAFNNLILENIYT